MYCPPLSRFFFPLFLNWSAPQQMLRTHCSLQGLLYNPMGKMRVFCFSILMENRWNEIDRGKTEVLGENSIPVPVCKSQIPHGRTRDRTRRLTAWAMARPFFPLRFNSSPRTWFSTILRNLFVPLHTFRCFAYIFSIKSQNVFSDNYNVFPHKRIHNGTVIGLRELILVVIFRTT
jgi:hypothetical protein